MKLENEVVISEIVFGMIPRISKNPEGFPKIPHIPVPITCHRNYNSSFR
jgi:hypothetical protein